MNRTLVVASHTHWDREWYLPFEAFRARLVPAKLWGNRGRPERGEVVWAMTNPVWVGNG